MTEDEDDFIAKLDRMTIKVDSPDSSVRATYNLHDGIRIEVKERLLKGHTEESLADQVTNAVSGIQSGFGKAMNTIVAESDPRSLKEDHELTPGELRHREYSRQIVALNELGISDRDDIRIRMYGNGYFAVKFAVGTLARMGTTAKYLSDALTETINSTIDGIGNKRSEIYRKIYDEAIGLR